jgi:hypothetical protein
MGLRDYLTRKIQQAREIERHMEAQKQRQLEAEQRWQHGSMVKEDE